MIYFVAMFLNATPENHKLIRLSQYAELSVLSDNPAFRALSFVDPDGRFLMHRNGQSSYAIVPETAQDTIIKVRKTKAGYAVMPYNREHALIEQFSRKKFLLCRTPEALAVGNTPQFLAMKRLGADLDSSPEMQTYYQENGERIALALAEVAVFAYNNMGKLVHTDFHPNNSTLEPEERIGIIDIGAFRKMPPERMLVTPVLHNAKLALTLAKAFSRGTGHRFNLDFIKMHGESYAVDSKRLDRKRTRCEINFRSFMQIARRDHRTFRPESSRPH